MKITRKFTKAGQDPFSTVEWTTRSSKISNPDGSVVFEMPDAEVPETWSQLATDIMVSKYFRKAGVPRRRRNGPRGIAAHAERDQGDGGRDRPREVGQAGDPPPRRVLAALGRDARLLRLAEDAQAFYDELAYMMTHQMCGAQQPPVVQHRAQLGLRHQRPGPGPLGRRPRDRRAQARRGRLHPPPAARVLHPERRATTSSGEGGIMDLWTREARLFKYGSGTGTNFSPPAGRERAALGGGKSSGLMSWLKIGDRAAAAIKSGRHHPPRGEDGLPRHGPPRHRLLRELEGPRGDQGRGPGRGHQGDRGREGEPSTPRPSARPRSAWA
jgi:ribonucleoside-diphosphate reductase alpha chain